MVALVGRMIVENPAKRPNINHAAIRLQLAIDPHSPTSQPPASTAAQIVTNNVGTSLITRDEYVMNTGESASNSAAIAAASAPELSARQHENAEDREHPRGSSHA